MGGPAAGRSRDVPFAFEFDVPILSSSRMSGVGFSSSVVRARVRKEEPEGRSPERVPGSV